MNPLRTVVLVSIHAPPRPTAASARIGGLVRHLPDLGVRCVLVTSVKGPDPREGIRIHVPDVDMARIAAQVRKVAPWAAPLARPEYPDVGRSRQSRLRSYAYAAATFPDRHWPWSIRAFWHLRSFLDQTGVRPDAMVTSSPPQAVHFLGWAVAMVYGIPWVADLRDLWSQNPYSTQPRLRRRVDRLVEKSVLARADRLTTISEPLAADLHGLHGREAVVVPNGIDMSAFQAAGQSARARPTGKALNILHTGSLYGGKRHPLLLFEVLADLRAADEAPVESVRVDFVGHDSQLAVEMAARQGISDLVRSFPQESIERVVDRQRNADVLLLLLRDDPSELGTRPAKVFEYVAARRPILATGIKGGVADRFLQETGAGRLFSPREDRGQLREWLGSTIRRWRHDGVRPSFSGDEAVIQLWGHDRMARAMLEALPPR